MFIFNSIVGRLFSRPTCTFPTPILAPVIGFFLFFLIFIITAKNFSVVSLANEEGALDQGALDQGAVKEGVSEKAEEFKNAKLYRNWSVVGGPGVILLYGIAKWDWGDEPGRVYDEKFFQHHTYAGGFDKVGHFYGMYLMTLGYYSWFRYIGYSEKESNVLSTFAVSMIGTFIEIGDSFSHYGFSYGDLIFDFLGVGLGYIYNLYPNLHKYADLQLQYKLNDKKFDVLNDYERMKIALAFHSSAIPFLNEHWYSRYFNLDVGFYARGYHNEPDEPKIKRARYLFAGLSMDLSFLIDQVAREGRTKKISSVILRHLKPTQAGFELISEDM